MDGKYASLFYFHVVSYYLLVTLTSFTTQVFSRCYFGCSTDKSSYCWKIVCGPKTPGNLLIAVLMNISCSRKLFASIVVPMCFLYVCSIFAFHSCVILLLLIHLPGKELRHLLAFRCIRGDGGLVPRHVNCTMRGLFPIL